MDYANDSQSKLYFNISPSYHRLHKWSSIETLFLYFSRCHRLHKRTSIETVVQYFYRCHRLQKWNSIEALVSHFYTWHRLYEWPQSKRSSVSLKMSSITPVNLNRTIVQYFSRCHRIQKWISIETVFHHFSRCHRIHI